MFDALLIFNNLVMAFYPTLNLAFMTKKARIITESCEILVFVLTFLKIFLLLAV